MNIGPGLISGERSFLMGVYSDGLKKWDRFFVKIKNKAIFLASKHLIFKTSKLIK